MESVVWEAAAANISSFSELCGSLHVTCQFSGLQSSLVGQLATFPVGKHRQSLNKWHQSPLQSLALALCPSCFMDFILRVFKARYGPAFVKTSKTPVGFLGILGSVHTNTRLTKYWWGSAMWLHEACVCFGHFSIFGNTFLWCLSLASYCFRCSNSQCHTRPGIVTTSSVCLERCGFREALDWCRRRLRLAGEHSSHTVFTAPDWGHTCSDQSGVHLYSGRVLVTMNIWVACTLTTERVPSKDFGSSSKAF